MTPMKPTPISSLALVAAVLAVAGFLLYGRFYGDLGARSWWDLLFPWVLTLVCAAAARWIRSALDDGRVGFAGLDVFEQEPLPADSPLWGQPNLIVTPHNSAYSFPEDVAQIFVRNYIRFIDGQPLDGKIDFDKGY